MRPLPLALVALFLGSQSPSGCKELSTEDGGSTTATVAP
jgi:hypothetical protein